MALPPLLGALFDVLFPPRCAACDGLFEPRERVSRPLELCAVCEVSVEEVGPACALCALPGAAVECCQRCQTQPPLFDGASALWLYGGAVATMLHRFKYEHRPHYAAALGEKLAALELPPADLVTHVPLHPTRRRSRTYDQALYLARALGRRRGVPVVSALRRKHATGRQVGLAREERLKNVEGAFELRADVRGRRIWLVDDVVTTGATVGACAEVLRGAGACHVQVVSVARALG